MSLITVSLVLFLIMDPIGNISTYLKMVEGIDPKRQRMIVIREMLIALLIMLFFNFLGEWIFYIFQFSEATVRISSGVILFLIALQILFPTLNAMRSKIGKGEPFITPLAIPLIAGPSLLATIMLYAHLEESKSLMLGAIAISWIAAVLVLLLANPLNHIFGKNGLLAGEKLMGMILVMLAIQRFLDGITKLVAEL